MSDDAPIGAVAVAHGVQRFNKNYLIDSEGCIVRKAPYVDQLKSFLVEEYAEIATKN